MENIRTYKELRVYIAAMDAAMRILISLSGLQLKKDIHLPIRFGGHHV